jgi:hypothetical protein
MGSTRLARIAGNHTAMSATPTEITGTKKDEGFHGFTPDRKLANKRVNPKGQASPKLRLPEPAAGLETQPYCGCGSIPLLSGTRKVSKASGHGTGR